MRRATRPVTVGRATGRISIHALHEESDGSLPSGGSSCLISIHALHEESDAAFLQPYGGVAISIHALHEESDQSITRAARSNASFQSTLSMRRATDTRAQDLIADSISIHALHEESDFIEARAAAGT